MRREAKLHQESDGKAGVDKIMRSFISLLLHSRQVLPRCMACMSNKDSLANVLASSQHNTTVLVPKSTKTLSASPNIDQKIMAALQKFKLTFFVPTPSLSATKSAIFAAGAGRYPNYSECCFVTKGLGQFRPVGAAVPNVSYLPYNVPPRSERGY
jgi:hypothetical protein